MRAGYADLVAEHYLSKHLVNWEQPSTPRMSVTWLLRTMYDEMQEEARIFPRMDDRPCHGI